MRRLTAVLYRDLKEMVPALLYIPLSIAVVCMLIAASLPYELSLTAKPFSLVICPGNDEQIASILSAMLEEMPIINDVAIRDIGSAEHLMESGAVDAVIFLPDDIEEALKYNERASIKIWAAQATHGTLLNSLAQSAADAVNTLQTAVYAYYSFADMPANDETEIYSFDRELLIDALTRSRLIRYWPSADPYVVQFVSIILFLTQSVGAICISSVTAHQLDTGIIRRMRSMTMSLTGIAAAKIIEAVCFGLLLLLPGFIAAMALNLTLQLWKVMLAACVLSLLCIPIYMLCAIGTKNSSWTVLLSFAVMLILLFTGGCVYPPYLTGFVLPSPASAAFSLAGWLLC